ncbi:MAG TPA: NAD-dependent deacylase [Longimicrobiaceae bacterium]|nr:NAD-dependent deacylase [Longimicrobiaceae bacterium]
MTPEGLERAADALAQARRVVVSTGAGMSAESGIPTFRDAQEGLWARFSPQQLATEAGFRANPRRVWSWYAWRRRRIESCVPHAGHTALVELEALVPESTVVTQNIDGLHQAADSREVIELHGNIRRLKCLDRGHPFTGELPPGANEEESDPPPCPTCSSPLRPDVVWFGEMLPEDATRRAWELAGRCDAMLVVGTSGTVWPAAELPHGARRAGATVIEVGPQPSEITRAANVYLQGAAGRVLPALVEAVRGRRAE